MRPLEFLARHVRFARLPAAAGNENDADALGACLGRQHVERQRQAVLVSVDDVFDGVELNELGRILIGLADATAPHKIANKPIDHVATHGCYSPRI